MTVATLRPDGWPQATTVGYANDGFTLYFLCGLESQRANNLAGDDRISLTIDHDTDQVMEIAGLSMAAHAQAVADPAETQRAIDLLMARYPEQWGVTFPSPLRPMSASSASSRLSSPFSITQRASRIPIW